MVTSLVRLTDGVFIDSPTHEQIAPDYERVELPRNPDVRRERYTGDVANPIRSLTDSESDALADADRVEGWVTARAERDTRLRNSDWIGVTDTQLTEADQTSWQTYRQVLRDVPQNQNDPENITWPDAPSD